MIRTALCVCGSIAHSISLFNHTGILKPSGHLILSMLMEESSCKLDNEVVISCLPITDQQLTSALEAAGLVIQETHSYLPDPNDPVESEDNNFSHALFLLAKKRS